MTEFLEASMLVCFGCSWPLSVYKNIKARTAESMSLQFILLIIVGYFAGICAKLYSHRINYVLAVYLLNLAVVSVNLAVYFINRRYDKAREAAKMGTVRPNGAAKAGEPTPVQIQKAKEYAEMNGAVKENGAVFFGSGFFSSLALGEITRSLSIDEPIYNRSFSSLCMKNVDEAIENCVLELNPGNIFINIGDEDVKNDGLDIDDFIERYHWLLYDLNGRSNAELYIVSVISPLRKADEVNRRLKSLAEETGCIYINAENAAMCRRPGYRLMELMSVYLRSRPISFGEAMDR